MKDFLGSHIFVGDIVIELPQRYIGSVIQYEPYLLLKLYEKKQGMVHSFRMTTKPINVVVIPREMLNMSDPVHLTLLKDIDASRHTR